MRWLRTSALLALFAAFFARACASKEPTAVDQVRAARAADETSLEQRFSILETSWAEMRDRVAFRRDRVEQIDHRFEEAKDMVEDMKGSAPLEWAERRGRAGRVIDELTRSIADVKRDLEAEARK
jgi:hypothetical protein